MLWSVNNDEPSWFGVSKLDVVMPGGKEEKLEPFMECKGALDGGGVDMDDDTTDMAVVEFCNGVVYNRGDTNAASGVGQCR
jgi:hypothetical protein